MVEKTNLFTTGTEDITEEFRDNVFMNQSGGESVRTAILINPDQVLEFYTDPESKKVVANIIGVADYIYEEFISYRHDMDRVYHVLDNQKRIVPFIISGIEIVEATDNYVKAMLKCEHLINGAQVELENDKVYLDRRISTGY